MAQPRIAALAGSPPLRFPVAEHAGPPWRPGSARLLQAWRAGVQALGAVPGDQQQFSGLHAGAAVAGHHVRLHDHRHPGGQREPGRGQRPARGRHDGREVAAAELDTVTQKHPAAPGS